MTWFIIVQTIIVMNLFLDLFFHVIHISRYCDQKNAFTDLLSRFGVIESRLRDVHNSTRNLQQSLSNSRGQCDVHIIEEEEEEEVD